MKTTTQIFILLMILLMSRPSSAQKTFLSLQVGRDISGSGLGGNVCPAVALTHGNTTFSLGPNFQRRRRNFSGYQFNCRYVAARSANKKYELYFAGNLSYHFSAFLSKSNVAIEQSCQKENKEIYADMKLSVVEGYLGIGLKFDPIRQISIGGSVGIGVFDTLTKGYDREMFREKAAPAMMLRAVLIYNFRK